MEAESQKAPELILSSIALKSYFQLVVQNYRALQRGKKLSVVLSDIFFARN